MKKFVLILLITCIFFPMCKQGPYNGDAIFIDLDKPVRASLFDYFSLIELIPLETSSDVLIAGIGKLVVHGGRYYALDPTQSVIFVFAQTGDFIFKLDKKGRGPGEYQFISDFDINPFTNNLELLEPDGFVHVFDLSGNFIETKQITFPGFRAVHLFVAIDSLTHVFHPFSELKKIIYFNLDSKKLLLEEFEETERLGSFASKPLYQFDDKSFFFRPVHPVVYKIGNERIEPIFKFDFGKYAIEGRKAVFSNDAERNFFIRTEEFFAQFPYLIQTVRHNRRYVFASLSLKNIDDKANVIYDKTTGESKFILDFTEQVLFNAFRGEEIIATDEYILMPSQWVDLDKRIKKEMLDERNKEVFDKLMKAPIELNPVLIKYHFK